MLVLGRKPGESVRIGDEIVITVLAIEGDRIKLGIEAPAEVRILRQELYESIREENLRAASGGQLPAHLGEDWLPSLQNLLRKEE